MSTELDAVRARLISLETAQADDTAEISNLDTELERLFRERQQRDEAAAMRKKEIADARREYEREQNLEAARDQATEVQTGVAGLSARFELLANGHLWFDGILPHQWTGCQFGAVAKRWILGDGVGLGKTRTTIAWLDLIGARKVLIVCEANICNQFAGEVMELAPHRTLFNLYKRKTRQRKGVRETWPTLRHEILDTVLSMDEAVIVVNYEIWRRDKTIMQKLQRWGIDTIIVDEAHNLKETRTANFRQMQSLITADNMCAACGELGPMIQLGEEGGEQLAVRVPCEACGWKMGADDGHEYEHALDKLLSTRSVKNVCLTTGTPILNSPTDLYSLLHLLDPILFKTRAAFETTFLTNDYHSGKWDFRPGALTNLKPLIEGRFLARTREDAGIILPPQRQHIIRVELDKNDYPLQYRTIRQISDHAQVVLDSGAAMTIMHLIALITRKRQANVWPGGIQIKDDDPDSPTYGEVIFSVGDEVQESVKLDAAKDEILDLHSQGKRQLVFSQFTTGLDEFATRLSDAGLRVAKLTGKTGKKLREEIKSNFYRDLGEEPKWDVLLCNYKAGGTGLNLTAATATHVIDEEWNPGKRNQAYGRTDRIGQTEDNDVYVYRIPGTIDTWMSNTIKRKEIMVEGFEGAMIEREPVTVTSFKDALLNGEML